MDTLQALMNRLAGTTVGHTRVIRGIVVTRWTTHSYEVSTWGMRTVTLQKAAEILMEAN